MKYELITYGAGEVLEQVFNAIAALMNGKTGTLYQPLVRIGLMLGLMWSLASMVYGDRARFLTQWLVPFYLALTLFFAPTIRLIITDPILNTQYVVDNVPWGLGATAGMISKIGDSITRKIESTFSLPDYLPYHKTGSVMASKIISQMNTFQITNPELKETMKSFVNQCVVYEAMMGRKYTLDDLKHCPDVWKLVSRNASSARAFLFRAPGVNKAPKIISCAEGVRRLEPILEAEVKNGFQYFGDKIFGRSGGGRHLLNPSNQIHRYLPNSLSFMMGMRNTAEEIMRQQMMMSAVVGGIRNKASELGGGQAFAIERAYQHQRVNKQTLAGVAEKMFLGMKNAMEAIIYVAFIFILPMAMLPMGWKFVSRWVGLILWIQMWPPLYAALNLISNMALQARSLGYAALRDKDTGVALANSVGLTNLHADMAAHAGFMSLAVGSLAYALVRGGAASFVHLAGHLSGPATNAAAHATNDLMSGNYSFGNINQGTLQANNVTFGQENWSPSYSGGAFLQNDGAIARTTALDGSQIINVANSNLRSSLNWSESLSQAYSEQGSRSAQLAENTLRSAAFSEAEGYRNLLDFSSHHAKQKSNQSSWASSTNAAISKAMTIANNMTDRFAQDHGITKEQANSVLAKAYANVQGGTSINLGVFKASANVGAEIQGSKQWSKNDRKLFSEAQDLVKQKSFQDAMNTARSYTQEGRYAEMDDAGKRFVKSSNASFDKSKQYREEHSHHLSQSESFNQMATWAEQNAGTLNANLNQEYVGWLKNQTLPHSQGVMGIHEAETILSSRPDLNMDYQRQFLQDRMAHYGQMTDRGFPSSVHSIKKTYEQKSLESPVKGQSFDMVHQEAENAGLGETFKVGTQPQREVQKELRYLQGSIEEQTEALIKESKIRKNLVKKGMDD